eukprot:scaffold462_cov101-Skeletonema_dohrnii-CCMP3373.AAC.2
MRVGLGVRVDLSFEVEIINATRLVPSVVMPIPELIQLSTIPVINHRRDKISQEMKCTRKLRDELQLINGASY